MNDLFEQMISQYQITNEQDRRNAIYEIMQQVTLAGLYRGGFFNKAAFYGGTCLRIFHNLPRFSEDMDFSLLQKDNTFRLEDYFTSIIEEFSIIGRDVSITQKVKKISSNLESAFLKDNTEIYNVAFQTEKSLKIKIEIDICPPLQFNTEQNLLLQPFSFMTRCFTLPDLYAGKLHALTFREWKNRVKGRDWYDFEWYVRNNVPLNFAHLQERIKEFNGEEMGKDHFIAVLKKRLATTNIESVKSDVKPYIKDSSVLEIWSNDYFLQLADKINFNCNKF